MTPEDSTGPFKIHGEPQDAARVDDEYGDVHFSQRREGLARDGLPSRTRSRSLMIAIVVVVLFVLILLFWSIPKPKRALNDPRLAAMQTRINQLAKRLNDVEGTLSGLADLKVGLAGTRELAARLDHVEAAYSKRLDEASRKIAELDKALKSVPKKNVAQKAGRARTSTAHKAARKKHAIRYHTVAAGDTLYSLSKRYGLTVARLRAINKLGAKSTIHPGQKLRVSP